MSCSFSGYMRLLFNAKWAIFQKYYGKNKLHVNEMMLPSSKQGVKDEGYS